MRTFQPLERSRFRWIYLNVLMLVLVLGSAVSAPGGREDRFASLASLLILAATAAVIAYESRRWKRLQILEAVRNDLERLSMESLCARTTFNLVDALSRGAQSKMFREDLNRRLVAVWASPLFVHGLAIFAVRQTLWLYASAIGLLCFVLTLASLPRRVPVKDAVIRAAFEDRQRELRSMKDPSHA